MIKLPTEPSGHQVAVWRELRKVDALSFGDESAKEIRTADFALATPRRPAPEPREPA
ncbi:hypothetical protein AB0I10_28565 [Streptomyces sp. NPDC050636]|uniref:hypothetical protein n=1 Tax=Streptomyces sp. NPDC050636 TaxID=3154510 RepID=UPI0034412FD2